MKSGTHFAYSREDSQKLLPFLQDAISYLMKKRLDRKAMYMARRRAMEEYEALPFWVKFFSKKNELISDDASYGEQIERNIHEGWLSRFSTIEEALAHATTTFISIQDYTALMLYAEKNNEQQSA